VLQTYTLCSILALEGFDALVDPIGHPLFDKMDPSSQRLLRGEWVSLTQGGGRKYRVEVLSSKKIPRCHSRSKVKVDLPKFNHSWVSP